jgi:hypothetical protein
MLLVALSGSGCIFSPDNDTNPPPPPPVIPFPGSEDQLIANFKTAYTSMRIDDYRPVLHPDYVFILRAADVSPGESDRFTYAEELAVSENMFSGLPIERPGDTTVPAISSISIAVLNLIGEWLDVGSSDVDFPNTRSALYEVQLTFSRAGANTIIVNGQQEFYVTSQDSLVNGETRQYFQLRGQRDRTIGN